MSKSQSHHPNDQHAKLAGIFFLALLVFNFPMLGIFGKGQSLLGIPVLYIYIFVVWLGIIFLLFVNLRKQNDG